MKTKLRKLLAMLMTVAMFISSVPTTALAAIVPVSGGTQTSSGISLQSVVKPPVATATYVFQNGDAEFARQILKNGETLNNPGTPVADSANKEFVGWFDESGNQLTFPYTASVTETGTIIVNARFEDVYFVFFTNEKGEVMVTKKGHKGDTITTADVSYPVGNEESITGWQDESGNEVSSVTLADKDITLKAIVTQGHWITYDSQQGSYVEPAFVKGDSTTTAPANPTRPGYTFDHWSETVNGAAFTFGTQLDKALTLYAVWTPNTRTQYTVIHWQENADDDDYSYAESETKTGATGATTSATAKSYSGFTAQTITQQTIAGDGSTIVNVYYKRNVYQVKFFEESGSWWSSGWTEQTDLTITAKHGANIRDKWPQGTFWYVSQSNQNTAQSNLDTMPIGGKNFYGKADGNGKANYYVEVLPGESYTETVSGKNYKLDHTDTGYSRGTVTDEERYEMTGFTCNTSASAKNGAQYNGSKFYYTRNSYNVVYINNGAEEHTASYLYEQSIADAGSYTPARPSSIPDSYTFTGWYDAPSGGNKFEFAGKTMPAQNVTVYARWEAPTSVATAFTTIIGGSSETIDPIPYGGTITDRLNELQATIMAQHPGYTWRGWRTAANGEGEPFNVDTKIYSDITLYPYYTKDGTFSVTYVSGKTDVTAPTDSKAYAEDSFADLMTPDKLVSDDGQYFLGWTDGTKTYQPRDKYQIKDNVTFTGVWGARPGKVSLTYKANGGAGADVVESLANNATVTTRPATTFTRAGYTFVGWNTKADGKGEMINENEPVQVDSVGENILYAIWTANTNTKYKVEFYYQNTDGTYTLNHSDEREGITDTTANVTEADKADKENGKYVFEEGNANNVLSGTIVGAGTLVLKLYFKLNTAEYTIHHYLKDTSVKVADDQTGTMTIGETLTAAKSAALYTEYEKATVDSYALSQSIKIDVDATKNVITVYYTVPLTLKAGDASKTYDGQPLTQPKFTATGLVNGDTEEDITLSMTDESTITNVGSTDNVIDQTTVSGIPSYYTVSYDKGTLTIKKASIAVTFTGASDTKTYTGSEQSITGITASGLLTGHSYEGLSYIAKGTNVGEYDGVFSGDVVIKDAQGVDVTENYAIKQNPGKLTITPITAKVTVTITEKSDTVTYDGDEHSITGYESMTADNKLYDVATSVKATETGAWTAKGTNAGEYPVGIVADDFENINKNFTNVEFAIVDGTLKINPVADEVIVTITEKSAEHTYDGTEKSIYGYESMVSSNALYKVSSVDAKPTDAWTAKGTDAGEYPVGIAAGDFTNNDPNFTNVTFKIVDGTLKINPIATEVVVTVKEKSATITYDGAEHSITGYESMTADNTLYDVTTSVEEKETGAWTAKGTNVGKYPVGIVAGDFKNKNKNFTNVKFVIDDGELVITNAQFAVTFTGETATKVYNGTKQSITGITVDDGLMTGHTYEGLTYVAEGTDVGEYGGVFSGKVIIRDANGVDVTENYAINQIPGKLTITPITDKVTVTITEKSDSVTYDGDEHSITGYESMTADNTLYDVATSVTSTETGAWTAKGTNAGEYPVGIVADDFKNTNKNFANVEFVIMDGMLKISPVADEVIVTITEKSGSVTYDGGEHSIYGYESMASNNSLYKISSVTEKETEAWTAKGTDAGEYPVGIAAGDFTNNDPNFTNVKFEIVDGTLKINPVTDKVTVIVTENSDSVTYDGAEHSVTGYKSMTADNKLYDVTTSVKATSTDAWTATGTNVGEYPLGIVPGDFANTNDNFTNVEFKIVDGALKINPVATEVVVTIYEANKTVNYNGAEHSISGYTFIESNNNLYNLNDVVATPTDAWTAKGTDAGEYPVGIKPEDFRNKSENFTNVKFKIIDGMLKIDPVAEEVVVTVTENSDTVTYDGNVHSVTGYKSMTANNDLYDVKTSVEEKETDAWTAKGTDAGEYPLGIAAADFANTNKNFTNVKFVIVDGALTINPVATEVIVTVTENSDSVIYDGMEHRVTGYASMTANNTLYDVTTSVESTSTDAWTATGTDVGEYPVGIVPADFKNTNTNFTNVTFVIDDGALKITPVTDEVIVTIKENSGFVTYDGTEHSVKGYESMRSSNTLYNVKTSVKETETAAWTAKGTNVGTYPVGIVPGDFENTNKNFTNVRFVIVDGELVINNANIEVTFTGDSDTKTYTGSEQSITGITVSGLLTGHTYEGLTYIAKGTYAGEYDGGFDGDVVIRDANGVNVTENYSIYENPGKLTITPITDKVTVTITEKSDTVIYDGDEHSITGYESMVSDNELYDVASSVFANDTDAWTAKGTNVGDYPVGIVAGDFTNTNPNFTNVEFIIVDGKLTITPITDKVTVTITEKSDTVTYDGGEHSIKGYASMVADNDLYDVTTSVKATETEAWTAKGTDAGEYPVGIVAGDFENINKNFTNVEFVIVDGALKINPVADKVTVTITEKSATATYDGNEHSVKGYASMTADNDLYDVTTSVKATETEAWTAKGTDAGEYPVGIVADDFENINKNFTNVEFVIVDGTLKINPVADKVTVTITENSDSVTYDGNEHSVKGYKSMVSDNTLYDVTTSVKATETLAWTAKGTNAGEYPVGIVAGDFANTNKNFTNVEFVIIDGTLTINPVTDEVIVIVTEKKASIQYDGAEHSITGYASMTANNDLYDVKTSVKETETAAWTAKGTNVGKYPVGIVAGDFENTNKNFTNVKFEIVDGELVITNAQFAVTFTGETDTKVYNGTKQSITGIEVEGLMKGHTYEGLTYVAEGTNVGEYDGVFTGNVIIRDAQDVDVTENYAINEIPGTLTITPVTDKVTVTITENSDSVTYDGNEHSVTGYKSMTADNTLYDVTTSVKATETAAWTAKGTDAGEYPVGIVAGDFENTNKNFANVEFVIVDGVLKISPVADEVIVTVTENSATAIYDGKEHSVTGYESMTSSNELYDVTTSVKETETAAWTAKGINVGEYPVGIVAGDFANTNKNFTNVKFVIVDGALTIKQNLENVITITTPTNSKVYDGTYLTDYKHSWEGKLAEGDTIVVTYAYDSRQREVGSHANAIDRYRVMRGEEDVTANYVFGETIIGTLTVTPRPVTITAQDNTVAYDGQPHGKNLETAYVVSPAGTDTGLVSGHTESDVNIDFTAINVGTYTKKLVIDADRVKITGMVDDEQTDVTGNYAITLVPGTLEIKKNETEIKVTANSNSWEYDGQPHSDGGYKVEYDGKTYTVTAGDSVTLPTGDVVKATITKTVTNVSDSAEGNNTIDELTIENANGENTKDQYQTITLLPGTLTITKRGAGKEKVEIKALPNTVEYDGEAHGAKLVDGELKLGTSYTTTRLVDGHYVDEVTLDITGSQTNVGVYEDELKPAAKAGETRIVIRDANGTDVTDNYELTLVNATLTITGDKIIPDKKAEDEELESNYKLGDPIEFTITVKNVSIYEVKNVVVTDANAEIQADEGYTVSEDKHTATIATIAANSEIKLKAQHIVTSEDILAGKVGNKANVTWEDTTREASDETKKLTPPDVTLKVTKTSDWTGKDTGAKLALGTKITYTITVTNNGNVPYTNVNFADVLQKDVETVVGEIPTYETLAVGETKEFTVTHIVTEADLLKGTIHNKVTAEADEITYTYYEGDEEKTVKATPQGEDEVSDRTDGANASTTSEKKTTSTPANKKGYALGETITYDIVVTNDGNLTVTSIEVTDNLAGAEIVAGEGYTIVNGKAVIDELKPGETATVKAKYVVTEADILAGKVLNDATVTGKGPGTDPDPDEPSTDDPTDDPKATIEITKSVEGTPANGTSYALGEKITYKLTVKIGADNNVTVKDIKVTDTLLTAENVTEGIVEIAGDYTLNAKNEIELPDMAPGAKEVVISYTYTVQESDLGSGAYGSVHNAAVSKGTTPDPENPDDKPDDPTDEDEKDTPTNIRLIITANDNTVEYDGQPHGENGHTDEGLAAGHTVTDIVIDGEKTNVGVYEDELVPREGSVTVKDADGNDVTDHYEITLMPGTLTITQKPLTITADSDSKEYDGTPLTKNSYTNSALAEGDKIESVTITGSITEVGSVDNVASAAVIKAGSEDVTPNYDITYVPGKLTITASTKELKVVANSNSWVYDGKQHADGGYTVTFGEETYTVKAGESATLSTGDKVTAVITKQVKNVSDTATGNNEIVTLTIENADQYANVKKEAGTLTITQKPLTITADGDSKEYDGTPLTKNSYTNSELAEGDKIESVTITGSITEVGSVDNVASAAVIKAGSEDVTPNYDITYVPGKLTITASTKELKVIANSNSWVYDGKQHSDGGYTVTFGDETYTVKAGESATLSTGDKVTATITKQVKNVSDTATGNNEIVTLTIEHADQYANVTKEAGTLTITQKALTITADSDEKFYDGTPLTKDGYTNSELAEGDKIESVTITGSITEVGSVDNVASAAVIKAGDEDVTGNYDITYVTGTLTVKAIPADGFADVTITKTWDDMNNQDGKRDDATLTLNASANDQTVEWSVLKDLAQNGASLTIDDTDTHVFAKAEFTDDVASYHYTFKNLPKYRDYNDKDTVLTYTVSENVMPNEFYQIDEKASSALEIVNVHEVATTDIRVIKVWEDENDNDGYRPDEITVKLYADGELYGEKTITANETGAWETTFDQLPVYKKGEKVGYTVEEVVPEEYTATYSNEEPVVGGDNDEVPHDVTITNRYEIKKMNIKVIKIWADGGNQDKLRPSELKFGLYKTVGDGEKELVQEFELKSSNGNSVWKHKDLRTTLEGLNVYENGERIHYSIEEITVIDGYKVKYIDNDIVGGDKVNGEYQTDFMTWVTNYHIIKRPNRLIGPMGMTSGECVE